jgi:small subunit ribosomal protein S17
MPKQLNGIVSSDKSEKTIVITVRTRRTHPIYKKQYTVNTKFMAHDEKNEAKIGDHVMIVETRPQSGRKRFKLDRILEKASARFEETDATADIPEEEPKDEPSVSPKARQTKAKVEEKTKAEPKESK